jgi:hypothetical protein
MIQTNIEWEEAACDFLNRIPGMYLNGQDLNVDERAILAMVVAQIGSPPELVSESESEVIPPKRYEYYLGGNSGTH